MFTKQKVFISLSYLFLVPLFLSLMFISLPLNSRAERRTRPAQSSLNLKVVPAKVKIKAGKVRHFHIKNSGEGELFRAENENKKIIWFVNGVKWGNKEVGKIDKKGRYRAPKKIAVKQKALITFEIVSDLNAVIKPAKVKVQPGKISNGKLLLRVKWQDNGRSARAEGAPADVKSVVGVVVKEDSPGKGARFTAGPVNFSQSRELVFNVPVGIYTVILEAFSEENGQGNVVYGGVKSNVNAVDAGGTQKEPKPVVVFLTRKDFAPSVSISPDSALVRIGENKKFSFEVSGVITDTGNPVSLFVFPKMNDLASGLKDFFSASKSEKEKLLKLWGAKYGTISKTGLYNAPKKEPSKKAIIAIVLKASIDDDKPGYIYDYAEVRIIPKLSLSVSPSSAELNLGETQQFKATVQGSISDTSVVWSIVGDDSTQGSVDTNGLYTAPSIMPLTSTITVRAVSAEDSNVSDDAKVTLTVPSFNISLTAPDMPMGSIYNLVAISTSSDFSNGAFSDPLTPSQELAISGTLEVKFTSSVSSGWDALDGKIVDVRTDRLLVDIPDGLPFGSCKLTVNTKGNTNTFNPLTITILPPFYETLDAAEIGTGDTTRGICTDKLHDGNGDFYVTSRSSGGFGDITKITPAGSKTLVTDKVEDVRGLEINGNGDIFAAEILAESNYTPPDRLIKIPAGSDTPITGFLTTVQEARGVAIDPDGNIFIADKNTGNVLEFSPSGGLGTVFISVEDYINGIDFNSNGDLFITDDGENTVYKAPVGETNASVFATLEYWGGTGVAVDYSGNVFVGERSDSIEAFDPEGNYLGVLDYTKLDTLEGLEIDLCNNLYALNRDSEVIRFTAPALPTDKPTLGGIGFIGAINKSGNDFIEVEITGSSFNSSHTVNVDGQDVSTEYVNETALKALVPTTLLTKEGKATVFVASNNYTIFSEQIFLDTESNTINFPIPKKLFISPSDVFVPQSQTQQFTAYVTGTANQSVVWSVTGGITNGTITSDGLYTAPSAIPSAGKVEILAVSAENSNVKKSIEIKLANLFGTVTDVQTQTGISGATVTVVDNSLTVNTDANGNFALGLSVGEYSLNVSKSGYQDYSSSFFVDFITSTVEIYPSLSPAGQTIAVGSVSGKVTDFGNTPLAGTVVTISGGSQTNGVFAAAETDSNGFYTIEAVPVLDTLGENIVSYTLTAFKDFFTSSSQTGISVTANTNTSNIDFSLINESVSSVIFSDSFETDKSWTAVISDTITTDTVKWQRTQNPSSIVNSAVSAYVTLPPGDTSGGALPSPPTGSWVMWFGNPSGGNYMGAQVVSDTLKSGGTSESIDGHGGEVDSPLIAIPSASSPELRFKSWFEIEGVNPNESGFDRMRIFVISSLNPDGDQILLINPFADPVVDDRDDKPYTSAGFNKVPIWVPYSVDLSAYKGLNIRVVFIFDTEDFLYNGFRGWLIDDVIIVDKELND